MAELRPLATHSMNTRESAAATTRMSVMIII
jgi:hypothetical protein